MSDKSIVIASSIVIVIVIILTSVFSSYMQEKCLTKLEEELNKYENPIVIKSIVHDKYGSRAIIEDMSGVRAFIDCTDVPCLVGDIGKLIISSGPKGDQIVISLDQAPVPPKNLPRPPSPPAAY